MLKINIVFKMNLRKSISQCDLGFRIKVVLQYIMDSINPYITGKLVS